jgi:uncharacterized protein (AIM24 family)
MGKWKVAPFMNPYTLYNKSILMTRRSVNHMTKIWTDPDLWLLWLDHLRYGVSVVKETGQIQVSISLMGKGLCPSVYGKMESGSYPFAL